MSKNDLIAVAGVTAGAVPSGFRLVPIEPTGVMKDCGAGSLPLAAAKPWAAGDCYRAMLAAAPLPAPATSVNEAATAAHTTENLVARLIKACRRDALTWTDRKAIGEAIARIEASAQQVAPVHAVEVPGVLAETWRAMATAPRDGTLIRLLVEFEDGATEDGEGPHPTIGSNTWDNHHQFDEWQFAGWNWTHDCFTQGTGKPVGWLPMVFQTSKGGA